MEKKEYYPEEISEFMEITSLNGNITAMDGKLYIHLHAVLADQRHAVHSGHVLEMRVGATCEMFITALDGKVTRTKDEALGTTLTVAGADMVDGTPIYDIKPYIPYADSVPDAVGGFAPDAGRLLRVEFPPELEEKVPPEKRDGLRAVLAHDPRPRYQDDPNRVYGKGFAGLEVRFRVAGEVLTVTKIDSAG